MTINSTFTSESVSEGHPDKMADQIYDAILDAIIAEDRDARVACETMIKTGMVVVAGEITTDAWIDLEEVCRNVILDIGYNSSEVGFDGASCAVLNAIGAPLVRMRRKPTLPPTGAARHAHGVGSPSRSLQRSCGTTPITRRSTFLCVTSCPTGS